MAETLLPQIFRKDAPFIKTYSYNDLLSENSYLTLYGGVIAPNESIIESYTTGEDGYTVTTEGNNRICQTFTVGATGTNEDFYFTKFMVRTIDAGVTFTCSIQETTAGVPNGTKLIEWVNYANPPVILDDNSFNTYQLDITNARTINNLKLSASTKYALVFEELAIDRALREDSTGATYTGGALYESANSGVNWTEQVNEDIIFWIYGSPTNPYILTSSSFASSKTSTFFNPAAIATSLTNMGTIDFSSKINIAGKLNGLALIELTASSVDLDYTEIVMKLVRIRNSTETEIGSVTSFNNATVISAGILIDNFQLLPKDKIVLRLTPRYRDANTLGNYTINHNPAGTQLLLKLPFRTE